GAATNWLSAKATEGSGQVWATAGRHPATPETSRAKAATIRSLMASLLEKDRAFQSQRERGGNEDGAKIAVELGKPDEKAPGPRLGIDQTAPGIAGVGGEVGEQEVLHQPVVPHGQRAVDALEARREGAPGAEYEERRPELLVGRCVRKADRRLIGEQVLASEPGRQDERVVGGRRTDRPEDRCRKNSAAGAGAREPDLGELAGRIGDLAQGVENEVPRGGDHVAEGRMAKSDADRRLARPGGQAVAGSGDRTGGRPERPGENPDVDRQPPQAGRTARPGDLQGKLLLGSEVPELHLLAHAADHGEAASQASLPPLPADKAPQHVGPLQEVGIDLGQVDRVRRTRPLQARRRPSARGFSLRHFVPPGWRVRSLARISHHRYGKGLSPV